MDAVPILVTAIFSLHQHTATPLPPSPQLTYVDLLLNHWPTSPASPTIDPLCDPKKATYDAKGCRLSTWRACAWQGRLMLLALAATPCVNLLWGLRD